MEGREGEQVKLKTMFLADNPIALQDYNSVTVINLAFSSFSVFNLFCLILAAYAATHGLEMPIAACQ